MIQQFSYRQNDNISKIQFQVLIIILQKMTTNRTFANDKDQIKLLNNLFQLEGSIKMTDKLIILYFLYKNPVLDETDLSNAHVLGKKLLYPDLNILVNREIVDDGIEDKYLISQKDLKESGITQTEFEIQPPGEKGHGLNNIWIYETEKKAGYRVVVIPIQEDISNIQSIRKEAERDENQHKQKANFFREQGYRGEQLKNAQEEWTKTRNKRFEARCQNAEVKHSKMFKIQAFVQFSLAKAKQVSICSLVYLGRNSRGAQLKFYMNEFSNLFQVPIDFQPQYIIHRFSQKMKAVNGPLPEASTIFMLNGKGEFVVERQNAHDEKYFSPTEGIKTKIYQIMQSDMSDAIIKVIQDFIENWGRITLNTCFAFGSVLNSLKTMMGESNTSGMEESGVNLNDQSSNRENNLVCNTFSEVFQKYQINQLWLPEREKLDPFYKKQLAETIKVQEGEVLVPPTIEFLVFYHFYSVISVRFLEKYTKFETDKRGDQLELLKLWKEGFKEIYELMKEVNSTILNRKQYQDYQCQNIQKFFNFLIFTIDSLIKLKIWTNKQISTASEMRSGFRSLHLKKQRILRYIIDNENNIKDNQPVHYYDLYLQIINRNKTQDIKDDMKYIELHIHELKAYKISKTYITNSELLVDAIKSYTEIMLKVRELSENKRKLIDVLKIQSKMARLLILIGQEEAASEIFMSKREHEQAHKCFMQILSLRLNGKGNMQAERLMQWGMMFLEEFEYDLALSYARKAFSYAHDPKLKQKAIRMKLQVNEKQRKGPSEDELRQHNNFLENEDPDLLTYSNKKDLKKILNKLKTSLGWDKAAKCSMIGESEEEEEKEEVVAEA